MFAKNDRFYFCRFNGEKKNEIFMYDLSNQSVNRLNGELSSKFVALAEENVGSSKFRSSDTVDSSTLDAMLQQIER